VQGGDNQTNANNYWQFTVDGTAVGDSPNSRYSGKCGPFRNLPCHGALLVHPASTGEKFKIQNYSDLGEDWEGNTDTGVVWFHIPSDGSYSQEVNVHGVSINRSATSAWTQYLLYWDRVLFGNDDRLDGDGLGFTMTEDGYVWATIKVGSANGSGGGDRAMKGHYVGINGSYGTSGVLTAGWVNHGATVEIPTTVDLIFPVADGDAITLDHRCTETGFVIEGYNQHNIDNTILTMRIFT
jgi:hypothetical protein